MKTTFMANEANVERKWFVVDAEGKTVGRLAAEVAKVLRGKHKPTFTPHVDTGDHVIIVNADKVVFTGKKLAQKTYFRHSGYPGGTTFTTAGKMLATRPERVLELAIKGMLPKNTLGRQMYRKLKVYSGAAHPHAAQMPEVLEIDVR
ncbi:50S ribosomal protein L13 [Dendrosporobacter sp. 1207_IL3150]|uniref:50S ribosomal protein L13 n=1 Tax=Dendrosporobacter sp. 1207_IL3150 TaxID=3084054 RepID=UPI002FD95913